MPELREDSDRIDLLLQRICLNVVRCNVKLLNLEYLGTAGHLSSSRDDLIFCVSIQMRRSISYR